MNRTLNIVSFLNLAVVGLILSTFTTRFIYPLISLEGRRFWILSQLPVARTKCPPSARKRAKRR